MAAIANTAKCQYVFLGNSGLRVSNICLGAMTFGKSKFDYPGQLSEEGAHKVMDRFAEWGGNFIDTANVYGPRHSERIVGSWLNRQERDRFVIASKVRFPVDPTNPNSAGLGRRHIMQSVDESLKCLQTDYIDLLQTHVWDDAVPLEETLQALNDLVRCGKIRYLGASTVTGWQMQKIVDVSKQMGYNPFISLQQHYCLLGRQSEFEPFQVCKLNGLGILPWSPLKGGFLTGKVKRDQMPEEGRIQWSSKDTVVSSVAAPSYSTLDTEHNWAVLDVIKKIATAKGKSMAQVSIRWLLQKAVVSSVIIGATKMHQLDDNMDAANGWELTPDEMEELDEVSRPKLEYPYNVIWKVNTDRKNPNNPLPYV